MKNNVTSIILPSAISEAFKPLTYQVPVGLLPIVNKPIMEHQVEWFVRHGIKSIRMSCNHMSNRVEEYFNNGARWGATISYNFERPPFGFVNALRHMKHYFENETLVIISSDIVTDIDLREALDFHWSKRADATFLCTTTREATQGLTVVFDEFSRIHSVGSRMHLVGNLQMVDSGICFLEPEVIELLPDVAGYNLLQACWLASQNVALNLFGLETEGPLMRINGWKPYLDVQREILEGKYPGINIPGIELQPGVWIGKGVSSSSHVAFQAPLVIGDRCRIGKGVNLGQGTIIGHDVMVDVGANLQNAVVLSNTFVGPQTHVSEAILQGNMMIDVKRDSFLTIEDKLAALEIEQPKRGYRFYLLSNKIIASIMFLLLIPFLAVLLLVLMVSLRFPLITRVKRIAPDPHQLAFGKLRLRVFDLIYIGPADLTKRPLGHNPDPLTKLPHLISRIGNLLNVIKGDIMIVGNRPMDPEIAFSITEEYRRTRLKCQGGVISILDTNEVDETTEEEQVISEGYYAVNRSFWMDMGILWRGMWRLVWRFIGAKKVHREYRPVPQEEAASYE